MDSKWGWDGLVRVRACVWSQSVSLQIGETLSSGSGDGGEHQRGDPSWHHLEGGRWTPLICRGEAGEGRGWGHVVGVLAYLHI